jgi:hypothetical protein
MQNVSELGQGFETNAIFMEPHWQVTFQAPEEDIDRIFDHITEFVALEQGRRTRTRIDRRMASNITGRVKAPRQARKKRFASGLAWLK